jgi:hypothetical protein
MRVLGGRGIGRDCLILAGVGKDWLMFSYLANRRWAKRIFIPFRYAEIEVRCRLYKEAFCISNQPKPMFIQF